MTAAAATLAAMTMLPAQAAGMKLPIVGSLPVVGGVLGSLPVVGGGLGGLPVVGALPVIVDTGTQVMVNLPTAALPIALPVALPSQVGVKAGVKAGGPNIVEPSVQVTGLPPLPGL